jgi:hypothetical protein
VLSASTSATALESATPQAQFDAFIERCARGQSPAATRDAVSGIQLDGLAPLRYVEADGADGSAWGFVFDLPIDDFRARLPALARATPMPVTDQAPPLFTRLTRSLQGAPSDPAKAFLVCTAERPDERAPPDQCSASARCAGSVPRLTCQATGSRRSRASSSRHA